MMAPSDASMFQWLYVRTPLLSPSMLSRGKMGGWAFFGGEGGGRVKRDCEIMERGKSVKNGGGDGIKRKEKEAIPFIITTTNPIISQPLLSIMIISNIK